MSTDSSNIVEIDSESFAREVIERSRGVPVVVDFWAPWCGPCQLLGPVLEKLATEYAGRFVLAKVNIDAAPEIARQYGVLSIPTVIAFRDGQPANSFVGVLGEGVIRNFIDRLMPTRSETLSKEAAQVEASDPEGAEAKYREAIAAASPLDAAPRVGLARLLLGQGRTAESRSLLDELEQRGYLEPEAETLKAQITLRQGADDAGSLDAARASAAADPADLAARFRLAEALAAAGEHAEALEIALDLVERDRKGTGEAARKLMIAVFNLLPPESDLAADFRRRLSFVI